MQDPLNPLNHNRYAYCLNNPTKYTDPSGEFWNYIIGGLIGATVSTATQVLYYRSQGMSWEESFKNVDLVDVAVAAGIGALTCGLGNGGNAAINFAKMAPEAVVATKAAIAFGAPIVTASFDYSLNEKKDIFGIFTKKSGEEFLTDYGIGVFSSLLVMNLTTLPSSIPKLDTPTEIFARSLEGTLEFGLSYSMQMLKDEVYEEPIPPQPRMPQPRMPDEAKPNKSNNQYNNNLIKIN